MIQFHFYDETPRWDEISWKPSNYLPFLNEGISQCEARIIRVLDEGCCVPAIVIQCPTLAFQTTVSQNTYARIIFDVVTAFPFPTPFAYVMPVIFDNEEDPYWLQCFLNLFQVKREPSAVLWPWQIGNNRTSKFGNEKIWAMQLLNMDLKNIQ